MPKAPAAPSFQEDEEDKTTLESGWEDEASTTVEQGEVADKIRAVMEPARRAAVTGITNTNGGADELTVDDQHIQPGISVVMPIVARLVITGGNDAGQELEMRPGKTYTVGRAIDNDIVLTDIAVSRKHFDLRNEAGAWILIDRGSGNGTLINNSLEDHPFMLANGDVIEIGNTIFRFDLPNGMPRMQPTYDASIDEEEPSTVAGKPVRSEEIATPSQLPPRVNARPKTLPPPAPLRARSVSSAPPAPFPAVPLPPAPAATLPMPQMANRPPIAGPHSPTMLGGDAPLLPGMMPTTIPGQGVPQQPSYGYPNGSNQQPQYAASHHGPPIVINAAGIATRDATSTALVPPTPYRGVPIQAAQPVYAQPVIPRRTKLILGGIGLTVFAAIATVAIIKGSSSPPKKAAPTETAGEVTKQDPPKATTVAPTTTRPTTTRPTTTTVTPIVTPKVEPPKVATVVPPTVTPKVEPPKVATVVPPTVTPKVEPPKKDPPKKDPPKVVAKVDPPKKDPPKKDPPKKDPPRKEPPPKRVATADLSGYKAKADDLYKAKNFAAASSTLKNASTTVGEEDAKELRNMAAIYSQFGKAYSLGMAPGTPPKDALDQLKKAKNLDGSAGRAYTSEIEARIGQVAPKAAVLYMAGKDYEGAAAAVRLAESVGSSSSNIASVKSALESAARSLYNEALAQKGSDPDGAKQKLRQVQKIVPSSSQWYQKASKALGT